MAADTLLIVLELIVFVAVFLVVVALGIWLGSGNQNLQKRLKQAEEGREAQKHEGEVQEGSFNVRWEDNKHLKMILPVKEWQESAMRKKLVYSGIRNEKSINVFLGAKVFLAIVLPTLLIIPMYVAGWFGSQPMYIVASMVFAALLGYIVPDLYLAQRARERRQELSEIFPDVLDLLVVCIEAGLGLDAAIQRVSVEIGRTSRAMEDELTLVTLETRAGKSRQDALTSLAERTQLGDIQSLVSIMIQAENFGTSVGEALREHAEEMREIRVQRAREKAAKLPVKLTIPILLFIFPALFLVILGPALMNIFAGLGGILGK